MTLSVREKDGVRYGSVVYHCEGILETFEFMYNLDNPSLGASVAYYNRALENPRHYSLYNGDEEELFQLGEGLLSDVCQIFGDSADTPQTDL